MNASVLQHLMWFVLVLILLILIVVVPTPHHFFALVGALVLAMVVIHFTGEAWKRKK